MFTLLLAVEDAFGFSMPDDDAAKLDTLGDLYDYVIAHRFQATQDACLRGIVLHKIRIAMTSALHVPRENLRDATWLSTIIPRHRRRAWRTLQQSTGLRLPQLRRPSWATGGAALASVGLAVAVPASLGFTLLHGAIVVAIVTAFVAGYLASWLTAPLAFEFQPDCQTVGELATATLARNFQAMCNECKSANAAEAWETLRRIVAERLGVPAGDLAKDTNLLHLSQCRPMPAPT
jgi:hypothetical protein